MDTRELVAAGVVVLLIVVVVVGFWLHQRYQRKLAENHFHIFRCRLNTDEFSVLAQDVREQTIQDLARRLTANRALLDETVRQRYASSSVADLHYDDVATLREMVKASEQELELAEFLHKKFMKKPEAFEKNSSQSSGIS